MTRVPQTPEELTRHLEEQLGFLRRSAAAYDAGDIPEAKRLAVHIRVLVHDTSKSRSLLGQLGMKATLAFIDGGEIPNPRNLLTTAGLTGIHFHDGTAEWVPKFAMPGRLYHALRPFQQWWTRPVLVDAQRAEISRRDLVLAVANTDGGAHVDPALDVVYARLSRQNSAGWVVTGPSGQKPIDGVEFASVRQVAWELLESVESKQTLTASPSVSSVGRNDPCPCGSGRKYKKCHGRAT